VTRSVIYSDSIRNASDLRCRV